jgi:hypothetical protein
MAYAQWVKITIVAKNYDVQIKGANLNWGKFYDCDNKDNEVKWGDEDKIIPKGSAGMICSCGRADSATGTEGSFNIYDGETLVAAYYWCCPWGSKTNTSKLTPNSNPDVSDNYATQLSGGNFNAGALGDITIKCVKVV